MAVPSDNPMLRYWVYEPDLGGDSADLSTADVLARVRQPGATDWMRSLAPNVVQADEDSPLLSRIARTGTGLVHGGINTMADWLDAAGRAYRGQAYGSEAPGEGFSYAESGLSPSATVAPLGLAPMGMALTPRNAIGSAGGRLHNAINEATLKRLERDDAAIRPADSQSPKEGIYTKSPADDLPEFRAANRVLNTGPETQHARIAAHALSAANGDVARAKSLSWMTPQAAHIIDYWRKQGVNLRGLADPDRAGRYHDALAQFTFPEQFPDLFPKSATYLMANQSRASVPGTVINSLDEVRTLYHGTPTPGFSQFDPSKIGSATDPGMFGHGVSLSFNPANASRYAVEGNPTTLGKGPEGMLTVGGKPFDHSRPDHSAAYLLVTKQMDQQAAIEGAERAAGEATSSKQRKHWQSTAKALREFSEVETDAVPKVGAVIPAHASGRLLEIDYLPKSREEALAIQAKAESEGYSGINWKAADEVLMFRPGSLKSATTGETLFSDTRSSVPGTVVNAQEDDPENRMLRLLRQAYQAD